MEKKNVMPPFGINRLHFVACSSPDSLKFPRVSQSTTLPSHRVTPCLMWGEEIWLTRVGGYCRSLAEAQSALVHTRSHLSSGVFPRRYETFTQCWVSVVDDGSTSNQSLATLRHPSYFLVLVDMSWVEPIHAKRFFSSINQLRDIFIGSVFFN